MGALPPPLLLCKNRHTSVSGSGLFAGSVVLMSAWLHLSSTCVGIEAQDTRASMATRSVTYNGCGDRVTIINGDLRDPGILPGVQFDVITGTMIASGLCTACRN